MAVVAALIATVIAGEGVFNTRVVIAGAGVAAAVARLVAVEVVERLSAALRERSVIAATRIVAVVDVAVEVGRAVEPMAGSDKHSVHKPIGSVVAVGRALIRRKVEVAVGTDGLYSKSDGDLGRRGRRTTKEADCECCECKAFEFGHNSS